MTKTLHAKDSSLKKLIDIEKDARDFGFVWPNAEVILEQAISETAEVRAAILENETSNRIQEEIGDLLHTAISLCMFLGYDVEQTLENTAKKFSTRMQALKTITKNHGLQTLHQQSTELMLKFWHEVKLQEKMLLKV